MFHIYFQYFNGNIKIVYLASKHPFFHILQQKKKKDIYIYKIVYIYFHNLQYVLNLKSIIFLNNIHSLLSAAAATILYLLISLPVRISALREIHLVVARRQLPLITSDR